MNLRLAVKFFFSHERLSRTINFTAQCRQLLADSTAVRKFSISAL
jgi:hypothetical protein